MTHVARVVTLAWLMLLVRPAAAASQTVSQPPAPKPFADRASGDWGGARSAMADRGVTIDVDWTHYLQGLRAGADDSSEAVGDADYGARYDAYLNLDTAKLALWKGGLVRFHAEGHYGDLAPSPGGVVLPMNTGVRLPGGGGHVEVTSMHLVQQIGTTTLIVGKINTVDLLASHPFFGGGGHLRFSDLGFAAPPNGLQPPAITGGILSVNTNPVAWTFMLFDANDRTQKYFLNDAFADGVTASVSAKYKHRLAGRTSGLTMTGIYSAKDGVSLADALLPPGLQTDVKTGSWHVSVQYDHFLHESATKPGTGWGLFVKAGTSDGNPNPFEAFVTGGVGGQGLLPGRPADTFGAGYYYYDLSDALQSVINPLLTFDDEQGFEVFYDAAVTPWMRLAANAQFVNPAIGDTAPVFAAGVRLKVRF